MSYIKYWQNVVHNVYWRFPVAIVVCHVNGAFLATIVVHVVHYEEGIGTAIIAEAVAILSKLHYKHNPQNEILYSKEILKKNYFKIKKVLSHRTRLGLGIHFDGTRFLGKTWKIFLPISLDLSNLIGASLGLWIGLSLCECTVRLVLGSVPPSW